MYLLEKELYQTGFNKSPSKQMEVLIYKEVSFDSCLETKTCTSY